MKQRINSSATVKVPKSTLMAIKSMLFNSETGTDLSAIVNDLAGVQADPDLVAINVALVFKGITIDTGENTRYEPDYKSYYQNSFESMSIILDQIVYTYKRFYWQEDGSYKEETEGRTTCSVAEWLDMATELDTSKVRGI